MTVASSLASSRGLLRRVLMMSLWFSSEDEEDDEELSPFSPPPTLSITEEILEFINQSRAREGLGVLVDTTVSRTGGGDEASLRAACSSSPLFLCPGAGLGPDQRWSVSI